MQLIITLDLDNEAFSYEPGSVDESAIVAVLRRYLPRLESVGVNHARPGETRTLFSVQDINGDTVGEFKVSNY